jgi:hypothetical protein
LLASIEDDINMASSCESMEAAADVLRGPDITLAAAVRWLRRRVEAVRAALVVMAGFLLNFSNGMLAGDVARRADAGQEHTLPGLRRSLPAQILDCIPAPLGFQPSRRSGLRGTAINTT